MTSTSALTILAIERLLIISVRYELYSALSVQSSLSKALVESVTIRLPETPAQVPNPGVTISPMRDFISIVHMVI